MSTYGSYKDSEIEWIGDIPSHWERLPLKYFGEVTLGKMLTKEDKGGYHLKPYLRSQNIQIEKVDISDVKQMWFSESELIKLRLFNGDLLFNEGGDVGRTSIWNDELEECYIQNSVNRVRFKKDNPLYYLFLSVLYHSVGHYDSVVNRVSIPHLTKEKLESVVFLRPPLPEQQQIVSFLDTKTSLIDSLIEKTQRKIGLLKEQRTSLINQVVTKGLNPDVEMKDSGVEWIGEIPSHWVTSKLGLYTLKIGSGSTPRGGSEVYVDQGVPFIRSQNVHFRGLILDDISFIDEETHNSMKGSKVYFGDVLLNITGGSIGRCCVVYEVEEMNVNQHVSIIRTKEKLKNSFLNYILNSDVGQSQVIYNISGGNREGLTIEGISDFRITLPPLEEQNQIVEYLDKETHLIDKTISNEEKRIELLKEYRQSLISEVVTGKVKVSGV